MRGSTVAYILLEDVALVGSVLGAFWFAHFGSLAALGEWTGLLSVLAVIVGVKTLYFLAGLYDFSQIRSRNGFWGQLTCAFVIAAALAWITWCALFDQPLACATFLSIFLPVMLLGRVAYEYATRRRGFRKRLLFMGVGREAQRTAREIIDLRKRDLWIAGFLAEDAEQAGWRIGKKPVLGTYDDVERIVEEHGIERVVVAIPDRRKRLPLEPLLRVRLKGVEVVDEARVHEETAGKIPIEELRPSWLIFSSGFVNSRLQRFNKRVFDVLVALVGVVASAPLAAVAALAIKLDSKGPILYRQKRVGQGGREFEVYKFRSMRTDAEAGGKAVWAKENDPRTTRVGKFLRKSRIDEIPQMWNVLQGTMSFVGPRPERLFFVEKLREQIPFYDQRHAVKPGLTGWAQVRFRYGSDETDAVEKLRHDMYYIKHQSILFDLRILLHTVRVVFDKNMGR